MTLFVCRGNMFRSPIAKGFYNALAKDGSRAESCGTWVGLEGTKGKTLKEIAQGNTLTNALLCMHEQGIDISQEIAKPITPELVDKADKVIVMAEEDSWPRYLKNNPKVVYWNIENPEFLDIENTRRIGEEIKEKIRALLDK